MPAQALLMNSSQAGPLDPLDFIDDATPIFYLIGDLGTIESGGAGTGVSTWTDQSGAGNDATQGTLGNRPAIQTANLGGKNTIGFAGDWLTFAGLNLPAPGTTPAFWLTVFRRMDDVANQSLWGATNTVTMRLFRANTTVIRQNNGVNGALVTMTVNQWYRGEVLYQNSATDDYTKIGSVDGGVGIATGNTDPGSGALTIGAGTAAGANPCNCEYGMVSLWNAKTSKLAQVSSWVRAYYGANVQT